MLHYPGEADSDVPLLAASYPRPLHPPDKYLQVRVFTVLRCYKSDGWSVVLPLDNAVFYISSLAHRRGCYIFFVFYAHGTQWRQCILSFM